MKYTKHAKAFRPREQTKGKPKKPKRQQKVNSEKKKHFVFYIGKGFIFKSF